MPAGVKDNMPATQGTTTMYQITSNNPPDGEYTDQQLLNLVTYYEASRAELKNVRKYSFCSIIQEEAFTYSVLIHYLLNQFLKPNKLI